MKWNLKRTKMLFALVPIMAVAFYILIAATPTNADFSYMPEGNIINVNILDKPNSGSPFDFSPSENLAIAAGVIYNSEAFEAVQEGKVMADLGITKYPQDVYNVRKVNKTEIFSEARSISSMKKVAEQKYYKNDMYLLRTAAKVSGNDVVWSDTINSMDEQTYRMRYGALPRELCKYIVNDETILSYETVSAVEGGDEFVYSFILNESKSTLNYKQEMKTMAGASVAPTFESVKLTIYIDNEWNVRKIISEDVYNIAIPVLGSLKCSSVLTETFNYIGDYRPITEADIFASYVPSDDETPPDLEQPKSAADYLTDAFAPYLAGEKLNLDFNILALNNSIDGAVSADISNMIFDIELLENIFLSYQNDNVYFNINGSTGFIPASKFSALLSIISPDSPPLDLGAIFGDDILSVLFENAELIESGDNVSIVMPIDLMGIKLDVKLDLVKQADVFKLSAIEAKVDIKGTIIEINAFPTAGKTFPTVDNSYKDYSKLIDFIQPIMNTVNANTYKLNANIDIKSEKINTSLGANISISKTASTPNISAKLNALGADFNISYLNDSLYLQAQNIKLKIQLADIENILGKLLALLPDSAGAFLSADLTSLIPKDIQIRDIFSLLTSFELVDGNTFNLKINIAGASIDATIKHNGEFLSELTANINYKDMSVSIEGSLDASNEITEITLDDEPSFIDVNDLTQFIDPIINLINGQTFDFDITAKIGGNVNETITAKVKLALNGNLFDMNISILGFDEQINIIYKNNKIFLLINNLRIKLNLDELPKLMETLKPLLPANLSSFDLNILADLLPSSLNINQVLGYISNLTFSENTLTASLNINGTAFDVGISNDENLGLRIFNLIVNGTSIDASILVANVSEQRENIEIVSPETYTDIIEVVKFINPIMNTINSKSFTLDLNLSLSDGEKVAAAVTGKVTLQLTEGFINGNIDLTIAMQGQAHKISVTVLDNENRDVYLVYNSLKVKMSYISLLKTIAMVEDILKIKIPVISDLTKDYHNSGLDTSIFDSMDIAGLDGLKETLNNLSESLAATKITDIIDLKKLVQSIAISINGNTLDINLDSAAIKTNMTRSDLQLSISKNDAGTLDNVSLSNLYLSDTSKLDLNIGLSTSEDISFAPPQDADKFMDFTSLEQLLNDFIKTANTKQFNVTGKIQVKAKIIIEINIDVPLSLRVVLDENNLPIVIGKLEIPHFVLATNTKTDTYIYFKDNMIYIKRDLYKRNWKLQWVHDKSDYKKCTPEEFLQDPMKFLNHIVNFTSVAGNGISDAVNKPPTPPVNSGIENTLLGYNFNGLDYSLKLDTGILAKNKDLGILDLKLSRNSDGHISKIYAYIPFVSIIEMTLDANLNNIGQSVDMSDFPINIATDLNYGTL